MKGMIVINPSSGQQYYQKRAKMAMDKLLNDRITEGLYVMYTTGKDSAYDAVSQLKPGEYDFVMAVGGDGTVNEVVNGIIDSGCEIPLVIYPAGTSNDFASSIGLPREINRLVRMIKEFCVKEIDVGKINDKYFLNVAAGGALSEVAHRVSVSAKTVLGRLAYIGEGVKEIGTLSFRTVPLRYEMNHMTFDTDTFLFLAANSSSVGGFSHITPHAKLDDGLIDVCILKKIEAVDAVPLFAQINIGKHTKDNKCVTYLQTDKIVISSVNKDTEFPVDCDGECGDPLPVTIEVVPKAVKILVPKNGKKIESLLSEKMNEAGANV